MISVAIIIVHFNTDQETKECIRSLQAISTKHLSVSTFVIDNGSKNALELNAKDQSKNTRVIRSDSNLGFTDGNNLGISIATREVQPDYFVLLNSDTTVQPDFLEKIVAAAQANPKLGMAVPKIYFSKSREFHTKSYKPDQRGKVLWFAGGSVDWANLDAFHRGVDEVDRQHFDSRNDTAFATGCCVLLPRTVVERVGTFDPKYFLYLEDVDWSLRIVQAGYEISFVPNAVVWHKNAGSSGGSGSTLHQYYQTRNRLYFFSKFAHMHFLSVVKQPKLKHYLALFWFYLRILKLAFQYLTSNQSMLRRATSDWLLNRMGKQAVF